MRWAAITHPNPLYGAVRWLRRNTARKCCWSQAGDRSECPQGEGTSDVKGITIMPANDLVDMHDDPATVLRRKPDSSMAVAFKLLKAGEGDALVSAGNTGALLTGATLYGGRIKASDAVRWHRLCRARTVRLCCAMRVQTPNAPPKCCCSLRSCFAVRGEDQRGRQAACRSCQQRHGGY